jgi:toxin ParE1/3/4
MAEVIWTAPALDDLAEIAEYISQDNQAAAERLVTSVFKRADLLETFPETGTKPREFIDRRYRQLTVKPLRIFYRYEADSVFIIYVMRAERLLKLCDLEDRDR